MVMDVVAADKIKLMEEEKDGPSRAMLRSILLSVGRDDVANNVFNQSFTQ
jgi:hypothetical protein